MWPVEPTTGLPASVWWVNGIDPTTGLPVIVKWTIGRDPTTGLPVIVKWVNGRAVDLTRVKWVNGRAVDLTSGLPIKIEGLAHQIQGGLPGMPGFLPGFGFRESARR